MSQTKQAELRSETAEALLAAAAADAGAGALAALKPAAEGRFRAMGAALPRDEYWRYLGPAPFNEPVEAAEPAEDAPVVAPSLFAEADPLTIVFVNGRFDPALSGDLGSAGVEIVPLAASAAGVDWITEGLGRLESLGQQPVSRPYAALNGALATDGLAIRATKAASRPIELRYLGETECGVHVRHYVEIAKGGAATLLETGVGAARFSSVLEADLAEGGALHHLRLQSDPSLARAATHLFARLAPAAALKSFTLSGAASNRVIRNESMIWLEGDDAAAHVAGGVVGVEQAEIDNTVFLTHGALRGESRQVYKHVLDDRAQGIFQGKILVREGAQHTDGYQLSQSVLLSETAGFSAKPELEIYADDVKCSHGSTTGALDEGALFYLRSRGVEPSVARRLLIEAFLEEAIEEIADETLAEAARVEARRLVAEATR